MATLYISLQLHQFYRQTAKAFKRVTKAVYDGLNAFGISYARTTHRGSTGGRKQRQMNKPIPVIVTSSRTALPTPSTRNNLALTVRNCGIGLISEIWCVYKQRDIDLSALTETWLGTAIDGHVISILVP